MKRSLCLVLPLAALVGCAHSSQTHANADVAPTTLTSASIDTGVPPDRDNRFLEPNRRYDTPPVRHTVAAMNQWGKRYPDAAQLLAQWVEQHPQTATKLSAFEKQNPERLRVLVDWADTHRYEDLGAFVFNRSGWDDLQQIASDDRDGFNGFLTWVRSAPTAARELAMHPEGLAYADAHYGDYVAQVNPTGLAKSHKERAKPSHGASAPGSNAGNPMLTNARVEAPPATAPSQPAPPEVPPPPTPQPKF